MQSIPYNSGNIQIIIIDDGSNSSETLEALRIVSGFNNCVVIHQENSGVSKARNVGLKNVDSEYVLFLDADDCFSTNGVEKVLSSLNQKADFFVFNPIIVRSNNQEYRRFSECNMLFVSDDLLLSTLGGNPDYNKLMLQTVWSKAYKTEIILRNGLFFNEKMTRLEDALFNLVYLKNTCTTAYISEDIYCYNVSSDSTVQKFNANYVASVCESLIELEKQIQQLESSQKSEIVNAFNYKILTFVQDIFHKAIKDKNISFSIKSKCILGLLQSEMVYKSISALKKKDLIYQSSYKSLVIIKSICLIAHGLSCINIRGNIR